MKMRKQLSISLPNNSNKKSKRSKRSPSKITFFLKIIIQPKIYNYYRILSLLFTNYLILLFVKFLFFFLCNLNEILEIKNLHFQIFTLSIDLHSNSQVTRKNVIDVTQSSNHSNQLFQSFENLFQMESQFLFLK